MKKVCLLVTMLLFTVFLAFGTADCTADAAESTKMTRYEFIERIVGILSGKTSASDSIFGGETLKIKVSKNGKISVGSKKASVSAINNCMKKYGISRKQAEVMTEASLMGIVGKNTFTDIKRNINRTEAAVILAKADELIYGKEYCPKDGRRITEEDIRLTEEERITDLKKIKSASNRRWFIKAYLYGFMSGKSDGVYTHTRTLNPKAYPSRKTLTAMADRLINIEDRIAMSADWQVCRTEKMPKTAGYYKYIIDSFPNDYYDTSFNGVGRVGKDFFSEGYAGCTLKERTAKTNFNFVFPGEIEEFNALPYPSDYFGYEGLEFLPKNRNNEIPAGLVRASEEFYRYALNVDYRTVADDKEWRSVMKKYMTDDAIDEYISHCRDNKTIIECDRVAADLSSVYWYDGMYNCKVYAHMRIISDEPLKKGLDDDEKYGTLFPIRRGRELGDRYSRTTLGPVYMDYKLGEWTDYYFNTNSQRDMYGYLNTSCTVWDIMTDYTGDYPWLLFFPYKP